MAAEVGGAKGSVWQPAFFGATALAVIGFVIAYTQWQRVTEVSASLAAANNQITQANSQITQLQQQLSEAQARTQRQATEIQAEAKPDLPLSVGFRKALLGNGLVLEIRNNGGSELEVAAIFSSSATGQEQRRNLVLPPNRVIELGSAEGWAFEPGQRIVFSNVNYRPAQIVVPSPR